MSGKDGITMHCTQWIIHAGNVNHYLLGWCGHVLQDIQVLVKTIHCREI